MDKKYRILIVEDNDFVRKQIVSFLQSEEFEIIEASNGQEALNVVVNDIDLAVVDVRMQPVDGFEFVRTIRAAELKTPVILVTGDDDSDLLNTSTKLDIAAVLKKPIQKERLIKTVIRILQVERRT